MTARSSPSSPEPKSPLVAQVQKVSGEHARFSPVPTSWGAPGVALGFLATYCVAWAGIEMFTFAGGWQSRPQLVSLLGWGGWYFTAAYFFQQSAAARIVETIERDIEPHASPAYLQRVTDDLERRHRRKSRTAIPLIVATTSLVAAVFAVAFDIEGGRMPRELLTSPEFLFFAATYFFYFLTAAQAVLAARFYLSFADHLEAEEESLYVLAAAESPLIIGLARLSSQVLVFWLMLFLTIVSSMLLASPWLEAYRFQPTSWFLLILVPVAGFFSLGFGTLVYLGSEARIRATLRRFTQKKLAPVRCRSNDLFPDRAADVAAHGETLAGLADLHDRVVARGRYGSRIGATLSLALPLALPVISIVKLVVGF